MPFGLAGQRPGHTPAQRTAQGLPGQEAAPQPCPPRRSVPKQRFGRRRATSCGRDRDARRSPRKHTTARAARFVAGLRLPPRLPHSVAAPGRPGRPATPVGTALRPKAPPGRACAGAALSAFDTEPAAAVGAHLFLRPGVSSGGRPWRTVPNSNRQGRHRHRPFRRPLCLLPCWLLRPAPRRPGMVGGHGARGAGRRRLCGPLPRRLPLLVTLRRAAVA